MNSTPELNTRVLVIDDDETVRDSFVRVLRPRAQRLDELHRVAAELFGEELPRCSGPHANIEFEVDVAADGRQGFDLVKRAVAVDRPYAVVFTDMRMPGWNGLETVEHIRTLDQRCEIIFVTAHSDRSIDSLVGAAGANIGYFLKPFAVDELKQMATKAVIDWNKARELERFLHTLGSLDGESADTGKLLSYLLGELCLWLGTDSGALVELAGGAPQLRIGRGDLASAGNVDCALAELGPLPIAEPVVTDTLVALPIKEFGVALALPGSGHLTPERLYLLRVFVEHASLAIRNSRVRAQLEHARRLSAMGEALGHVVHDIRGPLGNAQVLLDLLREDDESDFSRAEMFELLDKCLVQVAALVGDTLDYVRGAVRVRKRRVDLGVDLVRPLELVALELREKSVPLHVSIPRGLTAEVDVLPLVRALRNLAVNAAEALRQHDRPRVEIGAARGDRGVCVWVEDNGPGIPDSVRRTLFEPFVTAGKASGTGLGLAVVKLMVEAHGGTIDVHTGPRGTRFELHLG